jgi:hypothetical protein
MAGADSPFGSGDDGDIIPRFVYDALREEFSRSLSELPPDVDLEELARQEGGEPLESFIDQIQQATLDTLF